MYWRPDEFLIVIIYTGGKQGGPIQVGRMKKINKPVNIKNKMQNSDLKNYANM